MFKHWNEKHRKHPAYRFAQRDGLYRAYKRAEQELAGPWLGMFNVFASEESIDALEHGIPFYSEDQKP